MPKNKKCKDSYKELYSNIDAPFFSQQNLKVGWTVISRMLLVSFPITTSLFASFKILAVINKLDQSTSVLYPILLMLVIASPPVMIFLYNWSAKGALVKHYNYKTTKRIGWSLYWRSFLVAFAMQIPYVMSVEMDNNRIHVPLVEKQLTNAGLTPTAANILAIVYHLIYQVVFLFIYIFMAGWVTNTVFKKILSDETTSHNRAYVLKGLSCERDKEYGKAMTHFSKAINLDPNHTGAYYHRALIYQRNKEREKAIGDYNRIVEISVPQRDYSRANLTLKQILKLNKNSDKRMTLPHFQTALTVVEKDPRMRKKWSKKLRRHIASSKK